MVDRTLKIQLLPLQSEWTVFMNQSKRTRCYLKAVCVLCSPQIGQSEWTVFMNQSKRTRCYLKAVCVLHSPHISLWETAKLMNQSLKNRHCLKGVCVLCSQIHDWSVIEDQVLSEGGGVSCAVHRSATVRVEC